MTINKNMTAFAFHLEWRDLISDFSDEQRLFIYDAIVYYYVSGCVPEIQDNQVKVVFDKIKVDIDIDSEDEYSRFVGIRGFFVPYNFFANVAILPDEQLARLIRSIEEYNTCGQQKADPDNQVALNFYIKNH